MQTAQPVLSLEDVKKLESNLGENLRTKEFPAEQLRDLKENLRKNYLFLDGKIFSFQMLGNKMQGCSFEPKHIDFDAKVYGRLTLHKNATNPFNSKWV